MEQPEIEIESLEFLNCRPDVIYITLTAHSVGCAALVLQRAKRGSGLNEGRALQSSTRI